MVKVWACAATAVIAAIRTRALFRNVFATCCGIALISSLNLWQDARSSRLVTRNGVVLAGHSSFGYGSSSSGGLEGSLCRAGVLGAGAAPSESPPPLSGANARTGVRANTQLVRDVSETGRCQPRAFFDQVPVGGRHHALAAGGSKASSLPFDASISNSECRCGRHRCPDCPGATGIRRRHTRFGFGFPPVAETGSGALHVRGAGRSVTPCGLHG